MIPGFVQYFGGMVKALGQRYDGHRILNRWIFHLRVIGVKEKELTFSRTL